MKKFYPLAAAMILIPFLGFAQGTKNELETDFGTRTSIGVDKKISKGFHVNAEYELRTEDSFGKIGRHQVSLGTDYKIAPWLKGGLSYSYIYNQGKSAWNTRHRISGDLTFGLKGGDWRFSLKEQVRYTHKAGEINPYQEVRNSVQLKSRLKAQYKGFEKWEPYAFVEVRNIFNDPTCKASYSSGTYSNYELGGYNDAYINRLRGSLGAEMELNKHNALDFYVLLDYNYNKNIDTNKEGTKLKSLTWDRKFCTIAGVAYKFSF